MDSGFKKMMFNFLKCLKNSKQKTFKISGTSTLLIVTHVVVLHCKVYLPDCLSTTYYTLSSSYCITW